METPINTKLSAFYKDSFAHYTIKERLPVILTKVIDHLVRDKETILTEYDESDGETIKLIIGEISKLKYELQTNKQLIELQTNAADITIWNKYLNERLKTEDVTYFNTDWLYAETYMYRRLRDIFDMTTLKQFDPFRKQKIDSFFTSLQSMVVVADYLLDQFNICLGNEHEMYLLFSKLMKLCLWSNRCDLSISAGDNVSPIGNHLDCLDHFNDHILVNDIDIVWDILNKFNSTGNITIVTDNSGYELFTDLCLADFLIFTKLATKVNFHVKMIPWFISDVTPNDFHWIIDNICKSNHNSLSQLGKRWKHYLTTDKWQLDADQFWTLPFGYTKMKTGDSLLYTKLAKSKMILFKGDLNYRKLLNDINWPYTASFADCLQDFHPTNLCALRTNKADLICGLSADCVEQFQFDKQKQWLLTGEYGVIQCFSNIH